MADEPIDGVQNNTDAPAQDQTAVDTSAEQTPTSLLDMDPAAAPAEGEGEPKPEGDTPAEGAPEAYADFKLPEGMPVDSDFLDTTKAVFKEAGLSQEKAQKLVDLVVERDKRVEKAQFDQADDWAKEFMKSPTAKEDLAYAAKAREFCTPGVREMLKDPRIGNNPEILATFAKIGRMLSEDSMVEAGARGGASDKSAAEVIFGDMPGLKK